MNSPAVETPIIEALMTHAAKEKVSLHVPGHHQGRMMPEVLGTWLGQAGKLDATELDGLDNLHHATGCIAASERLAAAHYGADACLYSVNGATACVMAAIAACVAVGGKRRVILLGPNHISAWRGLVLADAEPIFVRSAWRKDLCTFAAPSVASLEAVLQQHTDIAAVYVTSPTYQGRVAPVAALAEVAHAHGVPLIVDEAHGSHFGLHPHWPLHSVAAGADLVIQSPHKTLPCLTQAAWIHLKSLRIPLAVLERHLLFLQTTSPSYLLLAALDGAQAWLRHSGAQAAEQSMEQLALFLRLELDGTVDPMRLWIPTGSQARSRALEQQLAAAGVFLEYADVTGALAIFGFAQPQHEWTRFFKVLAAWEKEVSGLGEDGERLAELYENEPLVSAVRIAPRVIAAAPRKRLPLCDAVGLIAATALVPYPPGVPLVYAGQKITQSHVKSLEHWTQSGHTVLGLSEQEGVEVVDEDETRLFHHI
ncbi:aminotransferase class I/II-fold pyridoxal phosphate-dependent enzyme [Alicyclobacillus fodiniaquatilis]|uniref:Aminotransferase class I/II-fold pyridoxal phosphate-dependent enzyme n=1 Tax=Alicyclobacillus fodiniaquatilis TaxID=1661150 RepID=A0ABW4JDR1_9BACL